MTTAQFVIKRYSDNPSIYLGLILNFCEQAIKEGNYALTPALYNPDTLGIETWLCFLEGKLISISAVEPSFYTNDPAIAARVCRYHILKDYRFTHCGLRMADHQIRWAREKGFEILYITHNVDNKPLNALYQRKKKIPVKSFNEFIETEWYTKLTLEKDFLFKTGNILQYVYSIRLQDDKFNWQPNSKYIVRNFDSRLIE